MQRPLSPPADGAVLAVVGLLVASITAAAAEHPGRIAGTVVEADGGRPIAGAYVGIGDFGDAGGTNLGRFARQGRYAHTKTDTDGRFLLENVAPGDHPLVVTHPEFVRHDQTATAREKLPEAGLRIEMRRAAKISATVVDAVGKPLARPVLIRVEARDGHGFLPPGRNPHLSAFAFPAWSQRAAGSFSFTELAPGEYRVDVLDMGATTTSYHGGITRVCVGSGEAKEVRVKPADHGTTVTVEIPARIGDHQAFRPMLVISRNPGLGVWSDRKAHGLEDPRLGRIQHESLLAGFASAACRYRIKNLPPGDYSIFVGPPVALQGARVTVLRGSETAAGIVWQKPKPKDVSTVGLWRLNRRVRLTQREYTAAELCRLLTAATESQPEFKVDPAIRDAKLPLPSGEIRIWDVVEAAHLAKGWRVDEEPPAALHLRPLR